MNQRVLRARNGERVSTDVAAVRRFNRFYTRRIGVLDEGHLHSEFSLAEVRVLYELAHRDAPTAAELATDLGLDRGYLSRMLARFARLRLLTRLPSPRDGRQYPLQLTPKGRAMCAELDARARSAIDELIAPLGEADRVRLVGSMETMESLLDGVPARSDRSYVLHPPRPGDLGWVVQSHGALYAREFGWTGEFEGLVAGIVADFSANCDPAREQCWIAEHDGRNAGSVFLMRHRERTGVAQLRLLLVEPSARGAGIGRRLVEECIRFARQAGYHTLTLWTQSALESARRIYEAAGFRLIEEEKHRRFGPELVGQTWELAL
jgi:DNA-binding MarR family transcriptional regulator/GNAT superfamily N-acetyltransferase